MKAISFSTILLFPLVVFFVMQYRIGPGDTPYALFSVIFLLLMAYVVADFLTLSQKIFNFLKNALLWVTVVIVLGSAFGSSIIVRHQTAPIYGVHDIVLQQEAAIRYFLHGKNPYKETYFGTPMQDWHYSDTEVNPALYHFVMEPFYLLSAIPFYIISNHTIGYFDGRIPLFFLFGVLLVSAFFIVKDEEKRRMFVTLLAFNPAMLGYTLEGRSDIYMYAFLFLAFVLMQKKKYMWAGIPLALAFTVKQSVWPLIPFYALYLFFTGFKESAARDTRKLVDALLSTLKRLSLFLVIFLGMMLPFYLWNPKAFIDSTVYYLSGNTEHSYPISGYGFGMVLHQLGVIKDVHMYFPFQTLQLLTGLPVFAVLAYFLWKKTTMNRLIIAYAFFLFVFWYFSRYFNNSHIGYISLVLLTAYFWPDMNEGHTK